MSIDDRSAKSIGSSGIIKPDTTNFVLRKIRFKNEGPGLPFHTVMSAYGYASRL